ncbi:NAD-dependent protein deacetylase sirtuin-2-like isoform X2 [Asterias rubens]|uniref:NAD-dependent protein deacetylase sirtuin-2-like isoform X2 n=1 Tax=Asterias rubens TaxID=7604 RepID=UPI001455AD87|nr:NAD-dependent protein deacetylase sirtuin-2-like isoform X2 [Asterias rubens]
MSEAVLENPNGAEGGRETDEKDETGLSPSKDDPNDDPKASGADPMDTLERLMGLLNPWLGGADDDDDDTVKPQQLLQDISLEGVAKYIKSDRCKHIIVMTGAGISTSAGIPDFRSPGSGLYDNLGKYNLPTPMSIFEMSYFKERPEPFFYLAKELYPGKFKPTPCHYFIRLLAEKKLLLRNYTQNIDTLERIAGVPGDLLMEAHGTFHTGHCLAGDCREEYTQEWMRVEIFADRIPKCTECGGLVKPDIVFFGEALPLRFSSLVMEDFPRCDLLIVMGTSLVVQPFASLLERVPETTPRLLINMEKAGESNPVLRRLGYGGGGFEFDSESNYRDVLHLDKCDDGCYKLAELLGWKEEMDQLVQEEHNRIEGASSSIKKKSSTPKVSASEVDKSVKKTSTPKVSASGVDKSVKKTSTPKVSASGVDKSVKKTSTPKVSASGVDKSVKKTSTPKVSASGVDKAAKKSTTPKVSASGVDKAAKKTSTPKVSASGVDKSAKTTSTPKVSASGVDKAAKKKVPSDGAKPMNGAADKSK